MGWTTITHPFHPLRGQRFEVLSSKTFNNKDILSLKGLSHGVVAVLREWTDKADPSLYQSTESPPILSYLCLHQLADLIAALDQRNSEKEGVDL